MTPKLRVNKAGRYLPALPFFLLVIFFLLAPLSNMVRESFLSPETGALTLSNYLEVLTKPIYLASMRNSLYLTVLSTVAGLVVSFVAAMAAAQATRNLSGKFLAIWNLWRFDRDL